MTMANHPKKKMKDRKRAKNPSITKKRTMIVFILHSLFTWVERQIDAMLVHFDKITPPGKKGNK